MGRDRTVALDAKRVEPWRTEAGAKSALFRGSVVAPAKRRTMEGFASALPFREHVLATARHVGARRFVARGMAGVALHA